MRISIDEPTDITATNDTIEQHVEEERTDEQPQAEAEAEAASDEALDERSVGYEPPLEAEQQPQLEPQSEADGAFAEGSEGEEPPLGDGLQPELQPQDGAAADGTFDSALEGEEPPLDAEPQPEPQPQPEADGAFAEGSGEEPPLETEPQAQPQTNPDSLAERRAIAHWASVDERWRVREIDFLVGNLLFDTTPTISPDGGLTQVLKLGQCYFLLYFDQSFPHPAKHKKLPVRVYLVSPSYEECQAMGLTTAIRRHYDESRMCYICDDEFYRDYERFCYGKLGRPLSEAMVRLAKRWERGVSAQMARLSRQASLSRENDVAYGNGYLPVGRAGRQISLGSAVFQDGRASHGHKPPRDCRRIVISSRAFAQIYTETQARITTETGGLLLGHYDNGTWYVIEACDPGWDAVFQVAYHEADENYENHVNAVTSRLYRHPLVFLGMWHRHPGSLDRFSGTDDVTNWQYVDTCPANGCISGLINYDPNFRMTFYFAQQEYRNMRYTAVDVEVGDEHFDRPELLQIATMADVDARDWR